MCRGSCAFRGPPKSVSILTHMTPSMSQTKVKAGDVWKGGADKCHLDHIQTAPTNTSYSHALHSCSPGQCNASTTQAPSDVASLQAQGATPGLAKTRSVPVRFKRRLADCLSPGGTFRVSKHHKLVESQRPSRSPAPSPERISTDGALAEPRHQKGQAVFQGAPPVSASFLAEKAQSLEGQLPPGLPLAPVDEHHEVRLLCACEYRVS